MAKQGLFILKEMKLKCGGALSKPENIFTADLIETPTYTFRKMERESLGNGWYGSNKEAVEWKESYCLVIKDGRCIGYFIKPKEEQRVDIYPLNKSILEKAEQILIDNKIEYKSK